MTRRGKLQAAVLAATVVTTGPLFALLCRGETPSRFAAVNLPFWERVLPRPARLAIPLRCPPTTPGAVQYDSPALQAVDVDQLPLDAERPHTAPRSRPTTSSVGQAGQWLEAACALGRDDPRLRQQQDEVATRLLNAQDKDGYLAGAGRARWSPAQVDAFSHNLRGLLAYYGVSHSPAAVYAAMQAGDLVTSEVTPNALGRALPDGLLLPMTRLCLATGEPRYRDWVVRTARANTTDGVGLCAAYAFTGEPALLEKARRVWRSHLAVGRADPEMASALWAVTGSPRYLASANPASAPWVCPLTDGPLTYADIPGGVAVNAYVPSRAHIGVVTLVQQLETTRDGRRTATITVRVPQPTAFTLRLSVPTGDQGTPRVLLNGAPSPVITPRDTFWTATRRWRSGDTVALALSRDATGNPAAGNPATARPVRH